MKNLTRDEAQTRAALLEVASYDVALDLSGGPERFGSVSVVAFSCREPGVSSFVELDGQLLTAELNGRPVGPLEGNRLHLTDLQAHNLLTVRARCTFSRTGEGLHRFVDPADGATYLYAQSFLDDAQRIFACFDQPDLKATFSLSVDAPQDWTVVANGRCTRSGGRWEFATTERMSTYLFTVAAGPWHTVTGSHDGIDLGLHCRRSLAEHLDADAAELFEVTAQCFDFQHERFGRRYPFGDTYDQLFVPEFNAGAMENPGAVTFSEMFVFRSRTTDDKRRQRAMVVAHEMSHMWFGDLVTMRWWDDLWLNESFAELHGLPHRRPGDPLRGHLGRLQRQPQGVGLPRRPAAEHPPGAGRRARHPQRAAELRRDLLRQGRLGAAPAHGHRRRGRLLRRRARLLRAARVRQHHLRRPARRARAGQRSRPRGVEPGVAADLGREHAAHGGRRRRRAPGSGVGRAAPAPDRRRAATTATASSSSGATGSTSR